MSPLHVPAMDWLSQKRAFTAWDLDGFKFYPDRFQSIHTLDVRVSDGNTTLTYNEWESEETYKSWLVENPPSDGQDEPCLRLSMHPRLTCLGTNAKSRPTATALQHSLKTFTVAAENLLQHRSISNVIRRKSTAVFNCQTVTWTALPSWGPSIVYDCKSDTESCKEGDDILVSVTSFPLVGKSFGVLYGGKPKVFQTARDLANQVKDADRALHPLLLPVMFAEVERKRLLGNFDNLKSGVYNRLNYLRGKLEGSEGYPENESADLAATELWMSVSRAKAGLEGLRSQLKAMRGHCIWLGKTFYKGKAARYAKEQAVGERIEVRLQEMISELDSKISYSSTLLGGMELATQIDWNHYSRQDAKASMTIAESSLKDSSQMKTITLLGVLFLPGTFLTGIFSMGFFKWIPDNSRTTVSPYLAIWFGLWLILTSTLYFWYKKWTKRSGSKNNDTGEWVRGTSSDEKVKVDAESMV